MLPVPWKAEVGQWWVQSGKMTRQQSVQMIDPSCLQQQSNCGHLQVGCVEVKDARAT